MQKNWKKMPYMRFSSARGHSVIVYGRKFYINFTLIFFRHLVYIPFFFFLKNKKEKNRQNTLKYSYWLRDPNPYRVF